MIPISGIRRRSAELAQRGAQCVTGNHRAAGGCHYLLRYRYENDMRDVHLSHVSRGFSAAAAVAKAEPRAPKKRQQEMLERLAIRSIISVAY